MQLTVKEIAMPYLDAALAFALTMLVVSTLVNQIVRFFKNTAKVRREGLQNMLVDYFNSEFQPVVQRELNRLKTTLKRQLKIRIILDDEDVSF